MPTAADQALYTRVRKKCIARGFDKPEVFKCVIEVVREILREREKHDSSK